MIDLKLIRTDPATVRASQVSRGEDPSLVDAVLAADADNRAALAAFETARAEQKALGAQVARAAGDEKSALLSRTKDLAARVKELQATADAASARAVELARSLGNIAEPGVPAGGEDDFAVLRHEGTVRDFGAEGVTVQDHLALGEGLRAIDMERGAKVSGSRFYFLTGIGARLELAILNAAMAAAIDAGHTPMMTPTLVRPDVMAGTGFLGAHADEIYYLEKDDLYLTGTSEVALAGYHSDEILDLSNGPLRYAGWSACYRREAGSAGRDTRGIIRVHQFHKVEMFSYVTAADAASEHARFLATEEAMLSALGAPVSRDRHGRGRPRDERRPEVRLRGVAPFARTLDGGLVDLKLHHLPGPTLGHPGARGVGNRSGRDDQRDHWDHALDRGAARESPAG